MSKCTDSEIIFPCILLNIRHIEKWF
jgi:hypothetical protein